MQPRRTKYHPLHFVFWTALKMALGVLLTVATTTQARADNAPLLVLADDEDPSTVTRKNALFKDLVSQLAANLHLHGFSVIDEKTLLAGLGRELPDRRTREEQMSMVRGTAERGIEEGIRAFVQLQLSVAARQTISNGTLRINVRSEFLSYPEVKIFDAIELPSFQISTPLDCNRDCLNAHVKKNYGEVAGSLAIVIAKKLSAFLVAEVADGPDVESDADIMYSGTPFTVTLRHFKRFEALTIVGVMADEFPGYQDHDLIALDASEAQYLYVTTARRAKLLEWLTILLGDMGFEADAIAMTFDESDITIERVAVGGPGVEKE